MQMCDCCNNDHDAHDDTDAEAQHTFDIGRSFSALMTAFNRQGSKILAPVSARHRPPWSMPGSRENSVPKASDNVHEQRDHANMITPRELDFTSPNPEDSVPLSVRTRLPDDSPFQTIFHQQHR